MSGDLHRERDLPRARYLSSFAYFGEMPVSVRLEFAVMGRSNVGKSSFINHIFADRKLARVSGTPGKTRLVNTYECNNGTLWVDLPGYGYAKAGGEEKHRWARLIGDYARQRENLAGIVWLLDIRHPGMEQDREALVWLSGVGRPVLPVVTKVDKVSRSEAAANVRRYAAEFGFGEAPVPYSIRDTGARENFWNAFDRWRNVNGV